MLINLSYILSQFLIDLFVILSVAFYTLMERKILSYNQNRKGPNKISLLGLAQPLSDAMKLLTKKEVKLTFSNNMNYWLPPFYSFFMLLLILSILPVKFNTSSYSLSWILFFCFIALLSFSTIFMGWSSNSKYTMLGSLRSLAQTISYEVLLILTLFLFMLLFNNFSMYWAFKNKMLFLSFSLILVLILFLSLVCEVNRAPFDLAEGESELVSGFNTEYGMTKFSLIFLTEYGMMIVMGSVLVYISNNHTLLWMNLKILFVMLLFLWLRASYPRIRYDFLMYLTWKSLLLLLVTYSLFLSLVL